ncbi:MAG: phenylpropionate dioxygenase-like ring-hydroxylating dioxygenase large terminal subunit [Dokdonia sp.]|jgi:phenylpropionate dioxygenase-like ring-hydroxylating dioxygenase large terminal subunit
MNQPDKIFPEKLFACWHPVGYSHEIKADEPFGSILLDEAIVIWRTSDGGVHAMRDLCIHRGTALSLGWIKNDCLVCPYHAWEYDKKGDCVFIPQSPNTEIPSKAKTPTYHCQEKFGLIWVAIKEPIYDLPNIPEYENSDWKLVNTGPFNWNSDSSRQVENFTDFGHFPWVHPGLLGDPKRPEVPDCKVTIEDAVLHYSVVRPEATNSDDFPVFANEDVVKPERRSVYELHLPYTIVLRLGWGGEKGMVYFFTSQPISQNKCRGYCIIGRNYNHEEPDTILQDFEQVIFDQDKRIVESQRPHQVPFDFTEELHLKFDTVAMNYRRAMKKQKLDY